MQVMIGCMSHHAMAKQAEIISKRWKLERSLKRGRKKKGSQDAEHQFIVVGVGKEPSSSHVVMDTSVHNACACGVLS